MMLRQFSKAGPWLFLLSVLWYLGGNFLIDRLHKNNVAHAQSLHRNQLEFEAADAVVISATQAGAISPNLHLQLDPDIRQISVRNDDLGTSVAGKLQDGVLYLAISQSRSGQDSSRYESPSDLTIRLPPPVQRIRLDDRHSVTLSGKATGAGLDVTFNQCGNGLTMTNLNIQRLKLTTSCAPQSGTGSRETGFNFSSGITLEQLEVNMLSGNLQYSADNIPHEIRLNLGDAVMVHAPVNFLRTAHFGKQQ